MIPLNQRPQSALDPLAVHYIVPCVTAHVLGSQGFKFLCHESIPWVTCGECLNNNSGYSSVKVAGGGSSPVSPSVRDFIRWKQERGQARMRPGKWRARR